MSSFVRLVGAVTLVALIAAAAFTVPSFMAQRKSGPETSTVSSAPQEDDPVFFYRDPMGGREISRAPKKDAMGMDFLPVRRSEIAPLISKLPALPASSTEEPLFYRDAMGGADISLAPKKDSMGMDYLPVRPADVVSVLPMLGSSASAPSQKTSAEPGSKRRILRYRHPMGLPDTSPVPKKDAMGMDYVPVYEGEEEEGAAFKVAVGKIQRSGVRSEPAQWQPLISKIRVPGSIQLDERRVAVVATRSEAFIEKVANVTTGDKVVKGQPLARLYSPAIAAAAADYLVVSRSSSVSGPVTLEGARRRLETLDVPSELYAEIVKGRKVPTSVSWPAPRDGVILERDAVDGMRADAGQVLFKIADLSTIWALVDVAEQDYPRLRVGQSVAIRVRGLPERAFAGKVALIYPQINKETRTARVRIELANPDLILRPDMYVDAEIAAGEDAKVIAVPESAVIDTGKRQLVLIDKGEGRFESRDVEIGRRGEGFVEVKSGIGDGDRVVTSANFLIDAESNLKAALRSLQSETDK